MHIASKKNGEPRRTVDFQSLNAAAGRETHHTRSPFHQAMSVPHNMKKTVLDAWNGYHSVPVREEDRKYLTFITEWGRFRYRTAPQGYIASGDGYTRRYDDIVAGIPNHTKCVDDCLLWEADIEKIFLATCRWLDVCGRSGIVMNPKKFQFAQDDVDLAGLGLRLWCRLRIHNIACRMIVTLKGGTGQVPERCPGGHQILQVPSQMMPFPEQPSGTCRRGSLISTHACSP